MQLRSLCSLILPVTILSFTASACAVDPGEDTPADTTVGALESKLPEISGDVARTNGVDGPESWFFARGTTDFVVHVKESDSGQRQMNVLVAVKVDYSNGARYGLFVDGPSVAPTCKDAWGDMGMRPGERFPGSDRLRTYAHQFTNISWPDRPGFGDDADLHIHVRQERGVPADGGFWIRVSPIDSAANGDEVTLLCK